MSSHYTAVAAEAALKAGAIQKARYGQRLEVEHKGVIDLVTDVDHACEEAILGVLRSRFPGHDIITEETDLERTGSVSADPESCAVPAATARSRGDADRRPRVPGQP